MNECVWHAGNDLSVAVISGLCATFITFLIQGLFTYSGELPLRQSDLGLTLFSAMLGALQVQDEMHVSFRIVARAAEPRSK